MLVLLLATPIIGFRIVDGAGNSGVETRFALVGGFVLFAFLAQIAVSLQKRGYHTVILIGCLVFAALAVLGAVRAELLPAGLSFDPMFMAGMAVGASTIALRSALSFVNFVTQRKDDSSSQVASRRHWRVADLVGWSFLLIALVLPFLPFSDRRTIDIATLVAIYVMLGWGLNIVVGLAGLLDLGYVAFFAIGAYSFALLSNTFGLGFWECLPLAGLFAAAFGVLLGFPVLRLRGDYLAIVTLGFGEIIRVILINWSDVTGGPNGITEIARPTLFGLEFSRRAPESGTTFFEFFSIPFDASIRVSFLYYVILVLALLTNLFTQRIRKLPAGRAWEALREDEIACRSLGINPTNTKLSAFAIGAMFGGFAGTFFAARQGFISPESFTFVESAVIVAIVVLGGMGSQLGIVIAAIILIGLPELFRELEQYRMLAFGAGMVLIMLWRPKGLLSHREPTILLNSGEAGPAAMVTKPVAESA